MRLVKTGEQKWDEHEGYSKKVLLDEEALKQKGARVQYFRIKPGEAADHHHHKNRTEIFFFLNDNGYFIVNGERIKPAKHDILVIESNDVHAAFNDTSEDYSYVGFYINYKSEDFHWDR